MIFRFALIYLLNSNTGQAELVASHAIRAGNSAAPLKIDLNNTVENRSDWPLRGTLDPGAPRLVEHLSKKFGLLPGEPWPEPSETALIVPITVHGQTTGFLVAGLSPRRVYDSDYASFLKLVAGHIGTSVANARAYELERRRAETLAEIDRAKALFFCNLPTNFGPTHADARSFRRLPCERESARGGAQKA
jgi:GAF domain-containing protein